MMRLTTTSDSDSNICQSFDGDTSNSTPQDLISSHVALESIARINDHVSRKKVECNRRFLLLLLLYLLSFQSYLQKHHPATDLSACADLFCSVSCKLIQRARDRALEYGRKMFCEVYKSPIGAAITVPLQISKFPAFKRKAYASKDDVNIQESPRQKKVRCNETCWRKLHASVDKLFHSFLHSHTFNTVTTNADQSR